MMRMMMLRNIRSPATAPLHRQHVDWQGRAATADGDPGPPEDKGRGRMT